MLLYLLELGTTPKQLEIWHQCIDGKNEGEVHFFDWPSTEGYVREMAKLFNITLAWQWREGGIHGEMHRQDALSKNIYYQYEGQGEVCLPTTKGKPSTRRKFPAKTADLNTRWCSAIKVDTARRAVTNISEFKGTPQKSFKLLFVTGERAEESSNRAKLAESELHKGHTKSRIAHHWRPIKHWTEQQVWDKLKEYSILPHPAYFLGFPRLSCMTCIFFTPDHWRTLYDVNPDAIWRIARKELEFKHTLDSKATIWQLVEKGKSYINQENQYWIPYALNPWTYKPVTNNWQMPAGAFGSGGGSI